MLGGLFVVSRAPAPNTLQAEDVVAPFQQPDLLPTFQDRLQADLTHGVVGFIVLLDLTLGVASTWVEIIALLFILAIAFEEELTHDFLLIVF